ncbi:alkaline phosphatase family protein [Mycolicibacterium sp. P9-64]|uniref:alkaline phosphatase family protein n=1 Tax=Mycolicibacterium sp. P9-64 TaxID=2024612 RepID=UPI001F5B8994|nr:alkaline phosphatase family protein [Mycolicibacterium sp. P9-64]
MGPTSDEDSEEAPPATSDEDTPSADPRSGLADTTVKVSASDDSADQHASSGHGFRTPDTAGADPTSSLAATVGQPTAPSPSASKQSQMQRAAAVDDTPTTNSSARSFTTAATTFTAATFTATSFAADSAPAEPQQHPTIISVITDLVAAVLQPFMNPGTGLSFPASLLVGVLSAVRNEIERALRRTAPAASQYTVSQIAGPSLLADPTPNVLLIGVDGTNLSRILADDENDNFFALMDDGTTAASSIVGHTTISNPSWTSILTGVWGERAGVINNVFTPWTYDNWPTVFNQLETYNPNIDTTTIADWNVINAISGAGSIPVDTNIYVPQIEGDTNWSQTDDAVGHATVDAIENTAADTPSFVFSYFVGVDENGHMHGGASPEYAEAIRNVDDNLGDILDAVALWEADNPGEEWTIIVVTDHGHQPQQGFGHGFQTPDETATFVIARGPDFNDGFVNPDYEIVDTTPTVLSLFGASPLAHADGVSLTTLGGSDADPGPGNLHQALEAMIATNHSPDIVTDVALSLRTIFATIPYYVWTLTNDGTLPIPILGNVLYVVTNVPAQIVALLTGVTGARFFPLLPPGPPSWPGQEEENAPDTAILACGGPSGLPAESACYASNAV